MKAVIMAGGKGTRLRPLTCGIPKPMVPLLNRPCMEYIIELLKKHNIYDIAVTVQYLSENIKNHFGDGSEFGVRLTYFEENSPLGTAGSVKNAEKFLNEPFIVISGDGLTDFDLEKAIQAHKEKQALATIVLTRVASPLEYGVVMTDSNGKITRFLEKPTWGEVFSDTVNTGIYILEPEVLSYFEAQQEFDFSMDLFPLLLSDQQALYGYVAEGYWSDIGNLQQYRQTQFDMLDRKVNIRIAATEVSPGVFAETGVVLPNKRKIKGPAYISSGVTLQEPLKIKEYTIIGRNNHISSGARFERTIIWDNNHFGNNVELSGATICSHVNTGFGAILYEGSIVGTGCSIGLKSVLKPNVKLWPNKVVQENSTIHTSLIWGEQMNSNLFGSSGITGIANVDITPDFASRLSAAYGAILPSRSTIILSASTHPFAQLIKTSLCTGLHAAGIHTIDLGYSISGVTRAAVKNLRVQGSIHVRLMDIQGEKRIRIEFMDAQGLPISKSTERKLENSYWQEDYVRCNMDSIGRTRLYSHAEDDYIHNLVDEMDMNLFEYCGLKIVIQYDQSELGSLMIKWIEQMGCKVISYHDPQESTNELIQLVKNNQANLGVYLNANGQGMMLVTESGTLVQEDLLTALKALVIFKSKPDYILGIPVSAPHTIETVAANWNGTIVRTKETARAMMEVSGDEMFNPLFDDIFATTKMIEAMLREQISISNLLAQIPQFFIVRDVVPCPWSEKGRIMRMLMSQANKSIVELVDGIKIFVEDGWVLILPDLDEPTFRIIAQSQTYHSAKKMITYYSNTIHDSYQTV